MNVGVIFPQTEFGNDAGALREYAQTAEALGYRFFDVYDHVLGALHADRSPRLTGPYTEATPFHEVFVLLSYVAALTSTIELVTGVLILPQRQTALVAKQAAEIQVLSSGRLRLGVGSGWNYVEYEALGVPFEHRGSRQAEQVELLRRLWDEPVVSVEGRFHRIDRAGILPRPDRRIPIWFGGSTEAAFKRAVRLGDGFLLSGGAAAAETAIATLRQLLRDAGRDPATFGLQPVLAYDPALDPMLENVRNWRGRGVSHIGLNTMGLGLDGPRAHIKALERAVDAGIFAAAGA